MNYRTLIPSEFARLIADDRLTVFRPSSLEGGGFEIKYRNRGAIRQETLAEMSWDAFRAYEPAPLTLTLAKQEQVLAAVGRLPESPTPREVSDLVDEICDMVEKRRITGDFE